MKNFEKCTWLIESWASDSDDQEVSAIAETINEMEILWGDVIHYNAAIILALALWASKPDGVSGLVAISDLMSRLNHKGVVERLDYLFFEEHDPTPLFRPSYQEASLHIVTLQKYLSFHWGSLEPEYNNMVQTACRFISSKRSRFS